MKKIIEITYWNMTTERRLKSNWKQSDINFTHSCANPAHSALDQSAHFNCQLMGEHFCEMTKNQGKKHNKDQGFFAIQKQKQNLSKFLLVHHHRVVGCWFLLLLPFDKTFSVDRCSCCYPPRFFFPLCASATTIVGDEVNDNNNHWWDFFLSHSLCQPMRKDLQMRLWRQSNQSDRPSVVRKACRTSELPSYIKLKVRPFLQLLCVVCFKTVGPTVCHHAQQ